MSPKKTALIVLLLVTTAAVAVVNAEEEPTPVPEAKTQEPAAQPQAEPVAESEPEQAKAPMIFRERTKIVIDGRAEFNGVLELVVTPHGEDSTKVRLNVLAKTKAKKITAELVNQLAFALGDRYKVKKGGDKKVMVKAKNKKTPPVSINLLSQQLAGVSVLIGNG
ncbi:MAG: hypothetical protein V2I67_10245 [Thermoanaerobaculales bacterium]|jgi:hypothetical protein|nr:hypothetical protein [Thermoanaerobaculales bacterium]